MKYCLTPLNPGWIENIWRSVCRSGGFVERGYKSMSWTGEPNTADFSASLSGMKPSELLTTKQT